MTEVLTFRPECFKHEARRFRLGEITRLFCMQNQLLVFRPKLHEINVSGDGCREETLEEKLEVRGPFKNGQVNKNLGEILSYLVHFLTRYHAMVVVWSTKGFLGSSSFI